ADYPEDEYQEEELAPTGPGEPAEPLPEAPQPEPVPEPPTAPAAAPLEAEQPQVTTTPIPA
ncbi:acyltransferase, partial [Streptomyces sp. NPDC057910]